MKINSDFRDLLRSFNVAGVRYLIVGGYAVMVHTEPRYTKDLDLWIDAVEDNARRMIGTLNEFGVPTTDVQPSDFTEPEVLFQIGIAATPARHRILRRAVIRSQAKDQRGSMRLWARAARHDRCAVLARKRVE